ncbi:MAG: glycosyltransferase family 39 protein [Candidatus Bathyarchaeota archaeon]|nr:glycosyltransferase family 39 protein [Candidatus Bathyarchaeota archaeon]
MGFPQTVKAIQQHMTNKHSRKDELKTKLFLLIAWCRLKLSDKWRLAFIGFILTYMVFLLWDLSYMSIRWDEVNHLNSGLLLSTGQFTSYLTEGGFYPPLFDLVTTVFFKVIGASVFNGRLVSLMFSVLSLWAVFEFGYKLYDAKIALTASVLLAVMPAYIWLSRMTMIETMLIFFFTVSALLFFMWLHNDQRKYLLWSGITLGLGVLAKYQTVIVAAIMLLGLLFLCRGYLKERLPKFAFLLVVAVLVFVPWIVAAYQVYASGMLETWLYAMNIGNPEKTLYSLGFNSIGINRFPHIFISIPPWLQVPLFYFFEMTSPYADIHPVSFFLYALGIGGLVLFAWRRKPLDKYLLIWFVVVYVFFTVIPNRHWRYIVPVFPVLAFAAASLISSGLSTMRKIWANKHLSMSEKRFSQFCACILIGFVALGAYYNVQDTQVWLSKDRVHIPIQEASEFAATIVEPEDAIVVMCTQNFFSQDMVRFYLNAQGKYNKVLNYPYQPVDTYTPDFDIEEFINLCKQNNVKYVFTYEYSGDEPYFNSTLSLQGVFQMLYDSGNFSRLLQNNTYAFGYYPRRIFILTFLG